MAAQHFGRVGSIDPFLYRTDVLALFALLAVPITLLQVVEIETLAVSLLAIPGYPPSRCSQQSSRWSA